MEHYKNEKLFRNFCENKRENETSNLAMKFTIIFACLPNEDRLE